MRNETPTVSVIVRAAHSSRNVDATLASICDQTFGDREVVLVHDDRRDAHAYERLRVRSRFPIRYVVASRANAGVARNAAIAASTGSYLAFVEADDLWTVDFLERQVWYLDAHPWCHLVYCDANVSGDAPFAGRRFMELSPSSGAVTLVNLIEQRCTIPLSTVVVRRDVIVDAGLFDETLEHGQAFDLWLRLAHRGARIAYQRAVLADCCVESGDPLTDLQRRVDVLEHFGGAHVLPPDARHALRVRSMKLLDRLEIEFAKRCFLDGNFKAAKYHLSAPRDRSLRSLMALLALKVAPRVSRRMVIASHVSVRKPAAIFR